MLQASLLRTAVSVQQIKQFLCIDVITGIGFIAFQVKPGPQLTECKSSRICNLLDCIGCIGLFNMSSSLTLCYN